MNTLSQRTFPSCAQRELCCLNNGADFEDGERGPEDKKYGQPLEAEKVKETHSPLEPPEMNTALLSPGFYPSEMHISLWRYTNKEYSCAAVKPTFFVCFCFFVNCYISN